MDHLHILMVALWLYCMLSSFTPLLTLTNLSQVRLQVSRENLFPPPRVYTTHLWECWKELAGYSCSSFATADDAFQRGLVWLARLV